jgi:hypothetical protein
MPISKCDIDKSGNCSLTEIAQTFKDNFMVVWDIIDTDSNGINLTDIRLCDQDNSLGCTKQETTAWLNSAGMSTEWNSFVEMLFDGVVMLYQSGVRP